MEFTELTPEKKQELKQVLFYWTQYATGYSDEGFYAELFDAWEELDLDDWDELINVLNLGRGVDDRINTVVYDALWQLANDDNILENILTVYSELGSGDDYDRLMREIDFDVVDQGYEIYDADTWYKLVDDSLRADGIEGWGSYLDAEVKNMDTYSLYELNGYANGFNKITEEDIFFDYGGIEALREYIGL